MRFLSTPQQASFNEKKSVFCKVKKLWALFTLFLVGGGSEVPASPFFNLLH